MNHCYACCVGDPELDKQQLFPNPIPGSEVWAIGSPSVHMTTSDAFVYNKRRPRSPEEARVQTLGGYLTVEWFGSLDLAVHGGEGVRVVLTEVAVVPGFGFKNMFSDRKLSPFGADRSGLYALGGRLRFVEGSTGNYVQASRVPHAAAPPTARGHHCFAAMAGGAEHDKQRLFPNPIPGSEVWSLGSPSVHMTTSDEFVYNKRRPYSPEARVRTIGGAYMTVEWLGSLNLAVHCGEDVRVTLAAVAVVPGFAFKHVFSDRMLLPVMLGPSGASALDGQLRFVRGNSGNYVQVTRVPQAAAPPAARGHHCFAAVAGDPEHDKQRLFPHPIPGSEVWSLGSPSVHMTTSDEFVYNKRRPHSPEEARVQTLAAGGHLTVEWFGMLDLVAHYSDREDFRVTLDKVAVVPGSAFKNMFCDRMLLPVMLGTSGASALDGQLRFVRGNSGNYVQVTRVPQAAAPPAARGHHCFAAVAGDPEHDKQRLFPHPIPGSEVWSLGSPSVHMTTSDEFVYNKRRPHSPEEARVQTLAAGGHLTVEWFGMLDLVAHYSDREDFRVTLDKVAVVPGFAFKNMFCDRMLLNMSFDETGVSTLNGQLRFVAGNNGNYVQVTRVPHAAAPSEAADVDNIPQ